VSSILTASQNCKIYLEMNHLDEFTGEIQKLYRGNFINISSVWLYDNKPFIWTGGTSDRRLKLKISLFKKEKSFDGAYRIKN
jgi:hypothetical protein